MSTQGSIKAASDLSTVMIDGRELATLSEAGYNTARSEDGRTDGSVDF